MNILNTNSSEDESNPSALSPASTVKFVMSEKKTLESVVQNRDESNSSFSFDREHHSGMTFSHLDGLNNGTTSEDDASEVILAIFWRSGKLGAAYYCLGTSEIYSLPDVVDLNPEFNLLKCIYNQVRPSQVITSCRVSNKFLSILKSLMNSFTPESKKPDGKHNIEEHNEAKLICLPGKDFHFETCKRRVLNIHLPNEPNGMSDEEHTNFIQSIIDLTADTMVQALGALLIYLDRTWAEMNLLPGGRIPTILAVNSISLDDIVTIDSVTYEALQIFNQQSHPSNYKKWTPGSSKEGLSMYGIFNRCKSQQGCFRMREMLLHPSRNTEVLKERLDIIDFCMKGKNMDVVKGILDCLKNITSVTRIMTKLAVTQTTIKEWKSLYKTIYNCILLGEICSEYAKEAAIFYKISENATEDLHQMAHYIYRVMDFDESEAQNKFVVRIGIDEELDKLKQKHIGLSSLMSKVAEQELESLPPEVKECSLMYLPEIGYILCLPMWKDNMEDVDFDIPGLEFKFKANRMAHYKSTRCKEMDLALGDCSVQMMTHEVRIMVKLIQHILEHLSPVMKIVKLAAELDCLIALATVARENRYVRPEIVHDERIIEIKGGRHPLQELCMDAFVPNDTYLGEKYGWSKMKLLTGPNASGKSVYLKQVALIMFLTHIGSFVPENSAKIGIIDGLYTRIRTTESVCTQLSAFMIDLCQMSTAINCSSPKSLIIIDEFGKGTSELDGLSLLASTLRHFINRGSNCPHILVSTHFHNIAQILQPSLNLEFQTLDNMFEEDHIIYLYKLKKGSAKSSFAHEVAQGVGLFSNIIKRSKMILAALEDVTPLGGVPIVTIKERFKKNVEAINILRSGIIDEQTIKEVLNLKNILKNY